MSIDAWWSKMRRTLIILQAPLLASQARALAQAKPAEEKVFASGGRKSVAENEEIVGRSPAGCKCKLAPLFLAALKQLEQRRHCIRRLWKLVVFAPLQVDGSQ